MHEFKKIVTRFQSAWELGKKAVIATVVALEGSSYRRPGVRMLILEDGKMVGAVSGGCVEKEIFRQAKSVFNEGIPKIMTYDGRYRLGCEGILYILIEPFEPSREFLQLFWKGIRERESFRAHIYFDRQHGSSKKYGSVFQLKDTWHSVREGFNVNQDLELFEQEIPPCFKLMIIGAEHDAVQLCSFAALTGWEVTIIVHPLEEKSIDDFPGAHAFEPIAPEMFTVENIDDQTAIVLMTHSYVKDLKYLLSLKNASPAYLGLLGPSSRRAKLLGEFMEHAPELSEDFLKSVHGPAGLNIGAETAQEISIAILSEILAVIRDKQPKSLRNKQGKIHS